MKDLESKVATANNISKTSVHSGNDARLKSKTLVYSKEITMLEKKYKNAYDKRHHVPPELSPFFVGRTKE